MGHRASVAWVLASLLAVYPSICCCTLDQVLTAGERPVAASGGGCCRAAAADPAPGAPCGEDDRHCPDRPCKCGKDRATLATSGEIQKPVPAAGALLLVLPRPVDEVLPVAVTLLAPLRGAAPTPATTLLRLHCALIV